MKTRFDFGYDVLGPIFFAFCSRLHLFLDAYSDGAALFSARGGWRLRALYDIYLDRYGYSAPTKLSNFLISRLSASMACLCSDFEYIVKIITQEFHNQPISNVLSVYAPGISVDIPPGKAKQRVYPKVFREIYFSPACLAVREFHERQHELLRRHINECTDGKKRIALIDTGWTGHTQAILMRSFRGREWNGAYFGKWDYKKEKPWHFYSINGLFVDDSLPRGKQPASTFALFHNHHVIEDPMEPPCESVSFYRDLGTGITSNLLHDFDPLTLRAEDSHFSGILAYFRDCSLGSFSQVQKSSRKAMENLARLVKYPRQSEVDIVKCNPRSWDYGRNGSTQCIIKNIKDISLQHKITRIKYAIWKQGQLRIEFGFLSFPFLFLFNSSKRFRSLLEGAWKKDTKQ